MSYLAKRTALLLENGDLDKAGVLTETQSAFLKEHLLEWAGDFTHATYTSRNESVLYTPLCRLMLGYISEDSELLCSLHMESKP